MLKRLLFLKQQAGFTMIELLIVISILGILAVAVLAAINPIEQINRGRDTGSRSDAEQLISAIDRYYAFNGYYPWQVGAADTANAALDWVVFEDTNFKDSGATCPVAEKLGTATTVGCSGSDELKSSFLERVSKSTYNSLMVYNRGTQGDSTYVCFAPKSKAFATETLDRLTVDLVAPTDDYPALAISNIGGAGTCGPAPGHCTCLP